MPTQLGTNRKGSAGTPFPAQLFSIKGQGVQQAHSTYSLVADRDNRARSRKGMGLGFPEATASKRHPPASTSWTPESPKGCHSYALDKSLRQKFPDCDSSRTRSEGGPGKPGAHQTCVRITPPGRARGGRGGLWGWDPSLGSSCPICRQDSGRGHPAEPMAPGSPQLSTWRGRGQAVGVG